MDERTVMCKEGGAHGVVAEEVVVEGVEELGPAVPPVALHEQRARSERAQRADGEERHPDGERWARESRVVVFRCHARDAEQQCDRCAGADDRVD